MLCARCSGGGLRPEPKLARLLGGDSSLAVGVPGGIMVVDIEGDRVTSPLLLLLTERPLTAEKPDMEWSGSCPLLTVSFGLESEPDIVLTLLNVDPVREHFCRRAFTADKILILSPTLVIPISLSTCWSKSKRISPRMWFARNVDTTFAHLASVSHTAT